MKLCKKNSTNENLFPTLKMVGLASVAVQIHQAATAAQAMNVGQMVVQRAVMAPTAETVRLKEHTGIATTLSAMGMP